MLVVVQLRGKETAACVVSQNLNSSEPIAQRLHVVHDVSFKILALSANYIVDGDEVRV